MSETPMPSVRTRVIREPHRAAYDRVTVDAILDEGIVCHLGFVADALPYVIPTGYGRQGDAIYIHGSSASRMMRALSAGVPVCLTVTLLDGLVLARSMFNHSMNYRSVVVLGTAAPVTDPTDKIEALRVISEHITPGRWREARLPSETELKATTVLRLPISEYSAKLRQGPPLDDEADYALPVWAGVIPLALRAGEPIDEARVDAGLGAAFRSGNAVGARFGRPDRD